MIYRIKCIGNSIGNSIENHNNTITLNDMRQIIDLHEKIKKTIIIKIQIKIQIKTIQITIRIHIGMVLSMWI